MHYHPELNDKVDKMVAMAPEGTLAYTKSILIRLTAAFLNPLMVITITKRTLALIRFQVENTVLLTSILLLFIYNVLY